MHVISHRGNMEGPNPSRENEPSYVLECADAGYDVEIDVWREAGEWFLGHDKPEYKIHEEFFRPGMWLHCKNLQAVEALSKTDNNWFWHEKDKVTITSAGYLWCYPGIYLSAGITVCGKPFGIVEDIYGVCTDYPKMWEKHLRK